MTRSWDNLVSALAGVQMAVGGEKWGQTGNRAGKDIHPYISPTVLCSQSVHPSVAIRQKQDIACVTALYACL